MKTQHATLKEKSVFAWLLGMVMAFCLFLATVLVPTPVHTTHAATESNKTYAKAHNVDIVMNGTTPFYCWNPKEPGTWDSWWYAQGASYGLNFNIWGTDYDMAMVWTAPKDGTFWAERDVSGSIYGNIPITTELSGAFDSEKPQTADIALVKGTVSDSGAVGDLTSLISGTNADSIFKTLTATKANMQTNFVIGYDAPISIKAGESFMIIAKKPSNHHQVRYGNFTIKFVENGKTNEEAVSYDFKQNVLTQDGYAAENYFSCLAIESNSYFVAPTEATTSADYTAIERANYKVSAYYDQHPEIGNGQFVNDVNTPGNWDIAVTGSAAKASVRSSDRDSAVWWKAEKDSLVYIDHATFANVSGAEAEASVLLKDVDGKFKGIAVGNKVNSTTAYSLTDVAIDVKAGEEIYFSTHRVESNAQVSFDILLKVISGSESLQVCSIKF